jgi:hypothetical protein
MTLQAPAQKFATAQDVPAAALRAIYEKGVSLAQSTWRLSSEKWKRAKAYASKRDKAKTDAVLRAFTQDMQAKANKANSAELTAIASIPERDSIVVATSYGPVRHRRLLATNKWNADKYESQMQSAIHGALIDGRYHAIGFEIPRKAADPPVLIPSDVLRPSTNFDWRESRIRGNGLVFEGVRLVPDSWLRVDPIAATQSQSHSRVDVPKKRRGPLSREDDVIKAFEELRARGEISDKDSHKVVWRKIFDLIVGRTGNPRGLDYTTVFPFLKKVR